MATVLDDKRSATRFRILVEIADRQPAVSQGEIAEQVGVTSQAVSEYTRGLVEDGLVEKEARSRYHVTKEGVDWLLQEAGELQRYADHVSADVLGSIHEDAAIALESIDGGETVSLSMVDGLLHATPGEEGPATGVATTDAERGDDVGVTGFAGVIDLDPGTVTVYQVPSIRSGGSDAVDVVELAAACDGVSVVTASGVEAVVALRRTGIEPTTTYAGGAVAADAATRGQDAVVVTSVDDVGRVIGALADAGIPYEVAGVE